MAEQDIRVRIVPEGFEGVAASLRKITSDAKAASVSTAGGVNLLTGAIGKLNSVIGLLGFTAGVAGIVAIGKAALDNADHVEKMAQITGSSAENFSVLAFGAKTTATSADALEKGLVRLSSTLGALSRGSSEQVDLFEELGLSAKDFDGKDTVQAFAIISRALEKIPDGFKKVDIQRRIIGRGATELQDLLQKVGVEGFDSLTAKAQQFGAVVSTETANQAEEFKRGLGLLQVQSGALSRSLLADFLPSLINLSKAFVDAKNESGLLMAAWVALGGVGKFVFKGLDKTDVEEAKQNIRDLEQQLVDLRKRQEVSASGPYQRIRDAINRELVATEAALAAARDRLAKLTPAADKPKPKGGDDPESEKSVQDKITEAAKRGGVDRLNIFVDIEKQRRAEVEKSAQVERAQLEAKLAGTGNLLATQQTLEEAEIASIKRRTAAAQEAFRFDTQQANIKEQLSIRGIAISKTEADYEKVVTGIHVVANKERAAAAQALFNARSALLIEYLNKEKKAQQDIVALDKQITDSRKTSAEILRSIEEAGFTDEQKIGSARIRTLEAYDALRHAVLTGNVEDQKKFLAEVQAGAKELIALGQTGLAKQFINDSQILAETGFAAQKLAAQNVAKAASDGAREVEKQIADIRSQIIELQKQAIEVPIKLNSQSLTAMVGEIQDRLSKEKFTIQVEPQFTNMAGGAAVPGRASGGIIPGSSPHPRADNILIRATAGEYMQPVRAVRHYGADFMEAIRNMELPRFADGGPVGGGTPGAGGDGGAVARIDISLGGGRPGRFGGSPDDIAALVSGLNELKRAT